jgi:hypothetical protein
MNNQKDLLKRLINLYPVKIIKDYFGIKGHYDDLSKQIVDSNAAVDIFKFAVDNINYSRQHVYIFDLDPRFNPSKFSLEDFPLEIKKQNNLGSILLIYSMPLVQFDISILNPYEETIIKFYQPIKIKISSKHLIFQVTTLEKDLSHYFKGAGGTNRRVVDSKRKNGEDVSMNSVIEFLRNKYNYTSAKSDIHKGIKKLWRDGVIDSKYVKHKRSRSTSSEAMDEDFTFKDTYPQEFEDLMQHPLIKTLFKYKKDDKLLCEHFHADPINGQIGVSSFAENIDQIEKTINEIIRFNR